MLALKKALLRVWVLSKLQIPGHQTLLQGRLLLALFSYCLYRSERKIMILSSAMSVKLRVFDCILFV